MYPQYIYHKDKNKTKKEEKKDLDFKKRIFKTQRPGINIQRKKKDYYRFIMSKKF